MITPMSNTHQIHIPFGLRPLSQCPLHLVGYIFSNLPFLIPIFSLFLYPLYWFHMLSTPLRKLARRTLWATLVALVTSATNVTILTVLNGQELGWVCLGSCGIDVIINALALFFVTHSYGDTVPEGPTNAVTQSVIRRRSVMPVLHTSEHQQGKISCPFASSQWKGTLVNSMERRAHMSRFCRVPSHGTSWTVCEYR